MRAELNGVHGEPFDFKSGRHLVLIAAIDEAGGIGKDGRIPWDCPEDRAFFKTQTMGHPLLVGRRTFESWGGRPLVGRPCAVWTRNPAQFNAYAFSEPFFASADVAALVEWGFEQNDIVYVCGGKMLYESSWGNLTDLLMTEISGDWSCNTRLNMDLSKFECIQELNVGSCRILHWRRHAR